MRAPHAWLDGCSDEEHERLLAQVRAAGAAQASGDYSSLEALGDDEDGDGIKDDDEAEAEGQRKQTQPPADGTPVALPPLAPAPAAPLAEGPPTPPQQAAMQP